MSARELTFTLDARCINTGYSFNKSTNNTVPSFLGIYTWLFENFSNPDGSPPGFFLKAGLGMTAGACGAFVGTPAEVSTLF